MSKLFIPILFIAEYVMSCHHEEIQSGVLDDNFKTMISAHSPTGSYGVFLNCLKASIHHLPN